MPSKPYITEGELYIAFEDLKARLQSLIDTGVITKNPVFDSATIRSVLMINDEGCLIDGEGNAIIADKQSTLVSGENIKTINGASILGPGNLVIEGGGTSLVAGEGIIITEDGHIKVDLEKIASKLYVDSEVAKKSEVTVSDTGTTTNTVQYITVDGTEYKLAGGSEGPSEYIKTAAYDDNTLVLLDQDDTPIVVSIPTVPTNVSSFTNDAGYLTEHQSLVDYVKTDDSRLYDARTPLAHTHTTSELTDWSTATANFLTEHQSLAGYATETYVNNHHDTTKQDVIDSEHKLDYSLLSNTPVIPTVPTNVSSFTNDVGYVTNEYHDSTKQNTLTPGTNIEIKEDGTINCTAEGKTYTEGNGIDISETNQISADNTVVAFQEDIKYTNENGCTVSVGGIAKGTTFDNKSVREILEDMLYPYVAFSGFSIVTTDASGTFEYGTTKSITKVTPKFTKGSKNINSIKIGTTSGGSDLYDGSSATSDTTITLTTSASWDGKANKTIYCTISDGTTTDTKSTTFTTAYYTYYKVTTSTDAPTSGCTKTNSTSSGDSTITTTANSYIWFLTKSPKTKIQQYVTGQWNDMNTTYAGAVNLTLSSGQTVSYHAYRTDKMVVATSRYQIV